MRIGVVNEDIWDFFNEVYDELKTHHQTMLFQRKSTQLPIFNARMNRYLLNRSMQDFLKENDVVFFEWASDLLVLASQLPKTCGLAVRIHRYDLYDWMDQVNWEAVDKVILVSNAKKTEFSEHLPRQADKVVVIPEAVSLSRFRYVDKPFGGALGILCHLKPRKRVYDLVLAFYELAQKRDDLHLYIGGDIRPRYRDYYGALRRLVEELGLQERVTFDGHIEDPENWYRKIDIFISNSYSEGLQVSPMEAIASGCYCLSHFWDGADELLPLENLFYTNTEFQEKVLKYCQESEEEKRAQRASLYQMVADRFDLDKTKVLIRELLEQLV